MLSSLRFRPAVRAGVLSVSLALGMATLVQPPAVAAPTTCVGLKAVTAVAYTGVRANGSKVTYGQQNLKATVTVNGTTKSNRNLNYGAMQALNGQLNKIRPSDTVTATFKRAAGCAGAPIGIASYKTLTSPSKAASYDEFLRGQVLYASSTTTSGTTLTVKIPAVAGSSTTTTSDCSNKHLASDRTYNGNGGDSPSGNQYASTCDGSASQNGNSTSDNSSKPCAGCVGNADNKNPPGQAPNGSDANNGYECDGNKGVGQSNPAHTGCAGGDFQFDLFTGPVLKTLSAQSDYFGPPGPSIAFAWK